MLTYIGNIQQIMFFLLILRSDDFEPRHLLKFTGNPELELHYRSLIYNLHRADVQRDQHRCRVCNAALSAKEGARLQPPQRMTKTIQKLMTKKSRKIPLSRIELYKLNKFMNSSQQMVVKCSECTFINKVPTIGRRDLIKFKSKCILEVEEATAKEKAEKAREERRVVSGQEMVGEAENDKMEVEEHGNTEEINEASKEKEPITKEKRKKKKNRKKTKDFISTLLQQKASEKKKAKKEKESSSTPVSLRDFVLSETQETPSPSHLEVFHKAIHSSSNTSCDQTPVCIESTVEINQQQSTAKSSSKKSKKKSKSDKELRKSLFFEYPESENVKAKVTTCVTPVTTQQSPATSSSKKSKKKIMRKELKKYLTDVPPLQEKSSSLKDFLISL